MWFIWEPFQNCMLVYMLTTLNSNNIVEIIIIIKKNPIERFIFSTTRANEHQTNPMANGWMEIYWPFPNKDIIVKVQIKILKMYSIPFDIFFIFSKTSFLFSILFYYTNHPSIAILYICSDTKIRTASNNNINPTICCCCWWCVDVGCNHTSIVLMYTLSLSVLLFFIEQCKKIVFV